MIYYILNANVQKEIISKKIFLKMTSPFMRPEGPSRLNVKEERNSVERLSARTCASSRAPPPSLPLDGCRLFSPHPRH